MSHLKSRISKEFVSVPETLMVAEAIEFIRKKKYELGERFLYVYTVDGGGKLTGVLALRDLLFEKPEKFVRDIMFKNPVHLKASDSETMVETLFRKHAFLALPVVNEDDILVGVVTAVDLANMVRGESSRLLHRFAGMSGEEIEGKSIFKIVGRRLPWLLLSMASGLMCAYILGVFIEEIESMIALVLFIPIVLGVAGGVGVQSSMITVRGLQKGELKISEIGRVLAKEIAIGLLIGVISCVMITIIALLWQKNPILGFALGTSVVACVVASGILGVLLPLILQAFRINPAFASGLFVLVICDIFVMVIYFSLSFAIINPPL
ncbi:MAG: magnesium transporter [Candidatus Omnitrophica bacterium]|nr:magnesium transporter [Candidatus Omnitrophota bacterium]